MENPLKKYSPWEWDRWLTIQAECNAPGQLVCEGCIYEGECLDPCYFCECFDDDCRLCMHGRSDYTPCAYIPKTELVDRAIERLEREGIFED